MSSFISCGGRGASTDDWGAQNWKNFPPSQKRSDPSCTRLQIEPLLTANKRRTKPGLKWSRLASSVSSPYHNIYREIIWTTNPIEGVRAHCYCTRNTITR